MLLCAAQGLLPLAHEQLACVGGLGWHALAQAAALLMSDSAAQVGPCCAARPALLSAAWKTSQGGSWQHRSVLDCALPMVKA